MESVIIIGGGCAGLTAALYCARAELRPILFAGNLNDKGGLLTKTSVVENYPGFPDGINGMDLILAMEQQAVKHGATIIDDMVVQILKLPSGRFLVSSSEMGNHEAQSVILATGSNPRKLGLPNEDKYWGRGISSCAVCDGALYKRKTIVVVGGGDTAMEEALFLTKFSDVTLIHRGASFRASTVMQQRVINNPKINIIYCTTVVELRGNDETLTSIVIERWIDGDRREIPVDGLFYGLGLVPNIALTKTLRDIEIVDGHVNYATPHGCSTNVPGLFVAGDVADKKYRQAIVACGDGCKAAMDAIEYLSQI